MVAKGLAVRKKSGRTATKYSAAVEPDEVRAGQLDVLVERVANGSVIPLVAQLLDGASLSSDDLKDLRKLVRLAKQRSRKGELSS